MARDGDATANDLKNDLQNTMEHMVGTRDLDEANRRVDTLLEWRFK